MDRWGRVIAAVIDRRSELGWTQKRLAAEAGVSERTIQNLEGGKKPQPVIRGKIEKALGWPAGKLERIAAENGEEPLLSSGLLRDFQREVGEEGTAAVLELLAERRRRRNG